MKKIKLLLLTLFLIPFMAHASILGVQSGGTGASTLTGCLTGNGIQPITGTGVDCSSGGGTNYFSNSGATTTQTTGTALRVNRILATTSITITGTADPVNYATDAPLLIDAPNTSMDFAPALFITGGTYYNGFGYDADESESDQWGFFGGSPYGYAGNQIADLTETGVVETQLNSGNVMDWYRLGVGQVANPQAAIDVYDQTGTGYDIGDFTTEMWNINNLGDLYTQGQIYASDNITTAGTFYQSGNAVCDISGTNCPYTGTVTSVTGSGNIASSGGHTPNITFTGTLPISNGGTGTSTMTLGAIMISTSTDFRNLTATQTTINTFKSGSATTSIEVMGYIDVHSISTDVVVFRVSYTDENGVAQTFSSPSISSVIDTPLAIGEIRIAPNTVASTSAVLTTGIGSISYGAGATISLIKSN